MDTEERSLRWNVKAAMMVKEVPVLPSSARSVSLANHYLHQRGLSAPGRRATSVNFMVSFFFNGLERELTRDFLGRGGDSWSALTVVAHVFSSPESRLEAVWAKGGH